MSAMAEIAGQDEEYAQLSAKRLSHYIFDVFTGALLLSQAQDELDDGNGRLALVASRFVERELDDHDARGITDGDRFALEYFEPIVQFEPVRPDNLSA
jgi:acyl-CoA dehydrogenase